MLGQPAEASTPGLEQIRRHIEAQLVRRPGSRLPADRVYRHFLNWWRANLPGERPPAQNCFGSVLGSFYRKFKSNGWFYCEMAFRSAD